MLSLSHLPSWLLPVSLELEAILANVISTTEVSPGHGFPLSSTHLGIIDTLMMAGLLLSLVIWTNLSTFEPFQSVLSVNPFSFTDIFTLPVERLLVTLSSAVKVAYVPDVKATAPIIIVANIVPIIIFFITLLFTSL